MSSQPLEGFLRVCEGLRGFACEGSAERRAPASADYKSSAYEISFIFLIRTSEGAGSKRPLPWRAMRSSLQLQVRRGGAGLGFGAHRRPTMKDEI